jgi:hypothetical protein
MIALRSAETINNTHCLCYTYDSENKQWLFPEVLLNKN